jgi:hypothetical protein
MESFQNINIKRIFGLPEHFHHTKPLLALDIKGIGAQIHSFKLSLYNRVFKVDSIARDFNLMLLAKFISDDGTVRGDAPGVCTYWWFLPVSDRPQ